MTKPIVENLNTENEDFEDNEDPLAGDVDPGYFDPSDPYNDPYYNPMEGWIHHTGEVF